MCSGGGVRSITATVTVADALPRTSKTSLSRERVCPTLVA